MGRGLQITTNSKNKWFILRKETIELVDFKSSVGFTMTSYSIVGIAEVP